VNAAASGALTAVSCLAAGPAAPLCWALGGIALVAGSVASCAGAIEDSCFPAHARVLLRDGTALPMSSLQLGQEVAVRGRDGALSYEPVYAWGHRERRAMTQFTQLDLIRMVEHSSDLRHGQGRAAQLELTPGHFAMVTVTAAQTKPVLKRASDVVVGDVMWVVDNATQAQAFGTWHVVAVRHGVHAVGIYNPYTLSGTIVVNGVVASCHSEWFADATFDALGLSPGWLPGLYQAALAPARGLWTALGKERYIQQYNKLDRQYGVSQQCAGRGLGGALGTLRLASEGALGAVSEMAVLAFAPLRDGAATANHREL
jgi:hypothetical protein